MMDKEKIYNKLLDVSGELSVIDSIGVAQPLLKRMLKECVNADDGSQMETIYETAALLNLLSVSAGKVDTDRLDKEKRILLSGNFIKSAEGVRWFLFGSVNPHESGEQMDKRTAIGILSQILKDVALDRYIPVNEGMPNTPEVKTVVKELTVQTIQMAMNDLAKDLNLEESEKRILILSKEDLERFLS